MNMVKTILNGEHEIILPEHRANRREYHEEYGWEKKRLASIKQHVKKGDKFIYIGNEMGDHSALISMWGCDMVLIEPNPVVWSNSKVTWEANKLKMPIACIVGFASNKTDMKGSSLIFGRFPDCANSEVISDPGFKELSKEGDSIPQIKIDDFVDMTCIIPNHISLDVEGSEAMVLYGAETTLRKYHPNIWLSAHPEFMFDQYHIYMNDLRRWIKEIGYTEELLAYDHEIHLFYTKP